MNDTGSTSVDTAAVQGIKSWSDSMIDHLTADCQAGVQPVTPIDAMHFTAKIFATNHFLTVP
ncbi:MAG: hypothetical protein BWK76_01165 [Desulfobulbaceae bacterium A2]|nr:MAG: hypothetical protein BWK76_01165 [Desulfobulbaceae bacterium A2]